MKLRNSIHVVHRRDFVVAALLVAICLLVLLSFRPTYLVATLIFFGIPSLYLFCRIRHNHLNILLFTVIVGVLFGFVVEILAVAGNAWHVQQVIPHRFFGIGYWEDIIWGIFYVFFVITFYKHFIERDFQVKPNKNFLALLTLIIVTNVVIGALLLTNNLPVWKYSYFWMGLIIVIPFFFYIWSAHRRLLIKGFPIFLFLAVVSLLYDLVALYIGNYVFAGEYIYAFTFLSHTLPLEDVFFWIVLTAPTLIGMYEYFLEGHG